MTAFEETVLKSPPVGREAFDPRVAVVCAVAFAGVVAGLHSLLVLTVALVIALSFAFVARLPLGQTLRRIAVVDSFIIVLVLTLPFTMAGETLVTLGGLSLSREGLERALVIALKANAVLFMVMALLGRVKPVHLGHALYDLRLPERLVQVFLFMVRYIDLLHCEVRSLRVAMTCRGFHPRTDLHTLRMMGYLVGILLVRSLARSERIREAMICRGFCGRLPCETTFAVQPRDVVCAVAVGGLCLGLLWGEYLV